MSAKIPFFSLRCNPNPFYLNPAIAASLLRVLEVVYPSLLSLRATHGILTVSGAVADRHLARRLVGLYLRFSPHDAILVHSGLRSPDPIASNFIIKSLVHCRDPASPIAFFAHHAHPVGCRPNCRTFPLLITTSKLSGSIHQGEIFHCLAVKMGFFSHLPVSNSLIHMYASCDALDLARDLFDEMPVRDSISYNSMIDGYVKYGDFDEAERLFLSMPDRSVVSWSTLLNGYVRNRMFQKGIQLFHQMQEHGVEPDSCSIISLLSAYSQFKLARFGKSVHGFLVRRWLQIPTHVSTALVDFYCNCGWLDAALQVFERSMKKDLISWNTLISGFGSHGRSREALDFFRRMLQDGVRPNDITFICVLVACAHSGLVEEALQYFKMMSSKFNIKPSFAHYWCLVDLYVRVESPQNAQKVIQEMPLDNLSAVWGGVIYLAKVHGDISIGELLGKRLIDLEPDNSRRYLPLVNVYAAASRWDRYKELQELMKARGLKKVPDCTLIDLNVAVHMFSVGDKSRPEMVEVYGVLQEIAEQLQLPLPKVEEAMVDAI